MRLTEIDQNWKVEMKKCFMLKCPFCYKEIGSYEECKSKRWIKCQHCGEDILNDKFDNSPPHISIVTTKKSPALEIHKPPEKPVSPKNTERKKERCPYCDELISVYAIKCPHCGESIIRCPQCGSINEMEYITPTTDVLKGIGKGMAGAFCGGLIFGPIGAVIAGIGAFASAAGKEPTGYMKCKKCGYIIK